MDINAVLKTAKTTVTVLGAVVTLAKTAAELLEDVAQALEVNA